MASELEIHILLARRYSGRATNQEILEWANELLNNDTDKAMPSSLQFLAYVARTDSEVSQYFIKALRDLGHRVTDKIPCLNWYIEYLARQIVFGELEPIKTAEEIGAVVSELGQPKHLINWVSLAQGLDPESLEVIGELDLRNLIVLESRKMFSPLSIGPETNTKFMTKKELYKSGRSFLGISLAIFCGLAIVIYSDGYIMNPSNPVMILLFVLSTSFVMSIISGIYMLLKGLFRAYDYRIPFEKSNLIIRKNEEHLCESKKTSTKIISVEQEELRRILAFDIHKSRLKRQSQIKAVMGLLLIVIVFNGGNTYGGIFMSFVICLTVFEVWVLTGPTILNITLESILLILTGISGLWLGLLRVGNGTNLYILLSTICVIWFLRRMEQIKIFKLQSVSETENESYVKIREMIKDILKIKPNKDVLCFKTYDVKEYHRWKAKRMGDTIILIEDSGLSIAVIDKNEFQIHFRRKNFFNNIHADVIIGTRREKGIFNETCYNTLQCWLGESGSGDEQRVGQE